MYFVDTSALLKVYLEEDGSRTVREAVRLLDGSVFVSDFVALELLSVLTRKRRGGNITQREYAGLYQPLQFDLSHTLNVVPVQPSVIAIAQGYVHVYREHASGGVDLVHLATAEHLQGLYPAETVRFMCSDHALRTVAQARGFDVFDPQVDALADLEITPLGF
ncbi:MAG TPA: type II toxin-antitoxin system VapC family toxin [Longimicrobium sp.]|nr:type II toxin-antitoxin system VapC family toxin [Longimicrobium sp.]